MTNAIGSARKGLRTISGQPGGYSGTGTSNWTVALSTLAKLFPGATSVALEHNS